MARSLIQTLVCVLLVNGSLYALHLTGNSQSVGTPSGGVSEIGKLDSSTSSMSQPAPQLPIIPHQKSSSYYAHSKSASPQTYDSLNEELADLAQLERERFMLMGLAKQTAEDISYNGRPIITGRIKMHASKGLNEDDSDNPSLSMQQARGFIYGNIRHRPAQHWPTQHLFSNDNESRDDRDYDGGGIYERRHPSTFEFGHIVQPSNERQFENLDDLNLDEFVELESVPDVEDVPDIDGYVYLDELLTEQNKERLQHHYQEQSPHLAPSAYRQKLSRLHYHDLTPSQLEDFFKNEQNQHNSQPVSLPALGLSPQYRQNKHLQQKWQRKRNPHLTRHIFGNTNGNRMQLEPQPLPQPQFSGLISHLNQLHSRESVQKLASASSEATATTKLNFNNKYKQSNAMKNNNDNTKSKNINTQSPSPFKDVVDDQKSNESQQQPQKSSIKHGIINEASSPDSISMGNKIQQQLEEEQKLQTPNHKRSSLKAEKVNGQSPQQFGVHSLANQLMLRTARGQRQYDVPQIECPTAMDGMERFACPTPDVQGRYRCIDDHVLCDGFIDCPEGEDEDRRSCMFYKTTKAHLDVLADALLRWARGR